MAKRAESKLAVVIDITDWLEESRDKELHLANENDLRERLSEGCMTGELARIAAANREAGLASDDILPPNKQAYYSGLREAVSKCAKRIVAEVELTNGKHISVPALIGRVSTAALEDDEDEANGDRSYVSFDTKAALERAERYLLRIVPGHVYNHLKIIAAAGGDVRGIVKQLKAQIDECAGRLY